MKKFYKYTGVMIGICFVIGLTLAIIGGIMGAKGAIAFSKEYGFQILNEEAYTYNKDMNLTEFKKVFINIDSADIHIMPSDDGKYGIEYKLIGDNSTIECTNKDGVLTIKDKAADDSFNIGLFTFGTSFENTIKVYVPKNIHLEQVEIICDAGDINVDGIEGVDTLNIMADASDVDVKRGSYGIIDISVDAGDVNLENVDVNKYIKSSMDAGDLDITGRIQGDINIEVDAGDIDVTTGTEKSLFNYNISASMGNVEVFGQEAGGFDKVLKGNADGKYSMEISVDAGDITVNE